MTAAVLSSAICTEVQVTLIEKTRCSCTKFMHDSCCNEDISFTLSPSHHEIAHHENDLRDLHHNSLFFDFLGYQETAGSGGTVQRGVQYPVCCLGDTLTLVEQKLHCSPGIEYHMPRVNSSYHLLATAP
jgi:hypothetical protein